jgi:hypothetical protein
MSITLYLGSNNFFYHQSLMEDALKIKESNAIVMDNINWELNNLSKIIDRTVFKDMKLV